MDASSKQPNTLRSILNVYTLLANTTRAAGKHSGGVQSRAEHLVLHEAVVYPIVPFLRGHSCRGPFPIFPANLVKVCNLGRELAKNIPCLDTKTAYCYLKQYAVFIIY